MITVAEVCGQPPHGAYEGQGKSVVAKHIAFISESVKQVSHSDFETGHNRSVGVTEAVIETDVDEGYDYHTSHLYKNQSSFLKFPTVMLEATHNRAVRVHRCHLQLSRHALHTWP